MNALEEEIQPTLVGGRRRKPRKTRKSRKSRRKSRKSRRR